MPYVVQLKFQEIGSFKVNTFGCMAGCKYDMMTLTMGVNHKKYFNEL